MGCIFICPYFGRLPDNFQLWLNSCTCNCDYDFFVISDDNTQYNYPDNVFFNYQTFEDFRIKVQSKFDFLINLTDPYKLCDFKPAYGYIFEEKIKGYSHWGHCDFDIILGKIDNFLTEQIFNNYKKILFLGHMTIYRNNSEVNRRFMKTADSKINYKIIFSSDEHYAFDELDTYSINSIYTVLNKPIYMKQVYADISCLYYNLYLSYCDYNIKKYFTVRKNQIFSYEDGKVYGYIWSKNGIKKKEYLYIHLQKRRLNININQDCIKDYLIIPNRIIEFIEPDSQIIKNNSKPFKLYLPYFKLKYKALCYRVKEVLKLFKNE